MLWIKLVIKVIWFSVTRSLFSKRNSGMTRVKKLLMFQKNYILFWRSNTNRNIYCQFHLWYKIWGSMNNDVQPKSFLRWAIIYFSPLYFHFSNCKIKLHQTFIFFCESVFMWWEKKAHYLSICMSCLCESVQRTEFE